MDDQSWLNFVQSGKVEDYLKYKHEVKTETNEHHDQGPGYSGTDNRGE